MDNKDAERSIEENWTVGITNRAAKGRDNLPPDLACVFMFLLREIEQGGPVPGGKKWKNYGKLQGVKGEVHHCHLNNNRPVYVVVWKVLDRENKIMEVQYVGSHENAPY
jgi:hypothetical protein